MRGGLLRGEAWVRGEAWCEGRPGYEAASIKLLFFSPAQVHETVQGHQSAGALESGTVRLCRDYRGFFIPML